MQMHELSLQPPGTFVLFSRRLDKEIRVGEQAKLLLERVVRLPHGASRARAAWWKERPPFSGKGRWGV